MLDDRVILALPAHILEEIGLLEIQQLVGESRRGEEQYRDDDEQRNPVQGPLAHGESLHGHLLGDQNFTRFPMGSGKKRRTPDYRNDWES